MRIGVLRHTWPVALALFCARLFSLWAGNYVGCAIAGAGPEHIKYGWLAYVTQAGITLGLTDEIAEMFPTWGPSLQATLISVIVLNQLVGPPLFEHALRSAGEAGRRKSDADLAVELEAEMGGQAEDREDATDETNSLRRNSL